MYNILYGLGSLNGRTYAETMDETTTGQEACDLGWAIAMAGRGYSVLVDPVFRGFPRGARGYQLLHTVIHKRLRSQIALADYLGVDRTVIPYMIDDLEAAGYVARRNDPRDRRVRTVTPTEQGLAKYRVLTADLAHAEDRLLKDFSEDQRSDLLSGLSALAQRSRDVSA